MEQEKQEIVRLQDLKKQCFEIALRNKPVNYGTGIGTPHLNSKEYGVDQLIKDANKIFAEITKAE